jgi:hypothetical protein
MQLQGSFPRFFIILGLLTVSAGLDFAQSLSTPAPTSQERTLMAEAFSTEKLAAWQKRLSLDDWKIALLVVRSSDLKPKTLGNIHWDSEKKTAVIRVLDPADYKMPLRAMLDDMEFTVVHELIHLELSPVLSPLQRNEANRVEEEHAVNQMAQALLTLQRSEAK